MYKCELWIRRGDSRLHLLQQIDFVGTAEEAEALCKAWRKLYRVPETYTICMYPVTVY